MSESHSHIPPVLGDRYSIERELGRGGMATVFLALDTKHGRHVAVKVLHPELTAAFGSERFEREISIEARLRHPHIVPLMDSGETAGFLYYVMPYVEGESLRQRLAARGALDIADAVRYWRDVIDAIAHAHRHSIVHRDIKPENVLLSERHAMVVDFGIGKALGELGGAETLTRAGTTVGTPLYMAPEQAAGAADADHRVDIYALGVLGYEMFSGRAPFASMAPAAQVASKMSELPPALRHSRPDVPPELARVVMRCLEPDPDRRWQSADELLAALESVSTPAVVANTTWHRIARDPRRRIAVLAAALLIFAILSVATYSTVSRQREKRWAREEALPEIRRLLESQISDSAFLLAARARRALPDDAELSALWERTALVMKLESEPAGARVYWTVYRGDTADWHLIGTTPMAEAVVPLTHWTLTPLLKYEKPGFDIALRPLMRERNASTPVVLEPVTSPHREMVRVRGGRVAVPSQHRAAGDTVDIPDFLIDRYEVTNAQYRAFVTAGGYERRDLWDLPADSAQAVAAWKEFQARFRDRTGIAGPASWEAGDFLPGRENYPVNGIGWFEARAYARFVGKELPTVYHWRLAAYPPGASSIVPRSNVEGSGLAAVGEFQGMTPFGVLDMAGNVREWCINAAGDRRYVLGGGWSEAAYVFGHMFTADPMDRSALNGMRLMRYLPGASEQAVQVLNRPAQRGFRDYASEQPAPESEVRGFLRIFDYDRSPLNERIVSADSTDSRWIRQTIDLDAAYGEERMRAHLFLPRNAVPPFQTVVYFPGDSVLDARSSEELLQWPEFVVTTGRALLYPIYMDTYERRVPSAPMGTDALYNMSGGLLGPNTYRDHVIMYVKDLRRSVDYLATRADMDTSRIAYYGHSWGGRLAPINLTAERRLKAAVLSLPGLVFAPRRPEVDEFNYLPQVRVPTLVMSGRYDDIFPLGTSVEPFFERLGTRPEDKRHVVYSTQHFLPRDEMIRETLGWLDRYLGRPRTRTAATD